jgi:hypothetical protein
VFPWWSPPARPASPRPPARPRQPEPPPRQLAVDEAEPGKIWNPSYVVVLWQAPELRERNPNLPLSLHEALQAGRPYDPYFPIPGLPSAEPDTDREAEP